MKPTRKFIKKPRIVPTDCPFCKNKTEPDYKEIGTLGKYLSERGKILARTRTGICNQHQKAITKSVKRARYVALLPFVVRA
ncbi:30S ribosomal protein S18 [Candidatus Gottesmanbacteria bacterium RIFCSPLOWO2_01_FULL_43_11b]|uniref:Small ribosomal subunit protein bS18 n=1 Tax=Candidatus Gottesmanbacteria bacterium RIFCSPLOWO2_01_FULL_43_11b TaxID=1798392 RepID=A0A1F6AGK0_9BACT|nr:MAG: 30S ribosomal protein S18 [Candidatus Gottesmanbacteria bacterium RIFCSPLOWO2_01_FULL_43_11b]